MIQEWGRKCGKTYLTEAQLLSASSYRPASLGPFTEAYFSKIWLKISLNLPYIQLLCFKGVDNLIDRF